ncbi:dihydrolipoyl dehydrogenase [Mucilaginibacter sp. UR6-11]|uniref:dihydrolipoyl dehydrogenase n=1 Tax=Mucilaginibacter sp. UR6-11 TaxID=1435644 RepID=UPI001E65BD20|nr:dihydrolipoyl dehydrogenase [Mucilaginibacter sp. UR6-11]MCC8426540.1 dihydrolipoyl dehydrogenase [Mucilaginibacter sp. UR6-11]
MQYDVIVIGSGPGGYVAAIRCAQLGLKTACIEKYTTYGGTCLNVGCIPSKALLDSSEHFYNAGHAFTTHGINLSNLKVDISQMMKRKADVVAKNTAGISFLFKKNKIDGYQGMGSFKDKNTITITKADGTTQEITGTNVIVATGSKPSSLPFIKIDKKRIITSTEALSLPEIPKHLVLIGGGVIGLELGSVYARLGAKVSVIEFMDGIIPTMDKSLGKELQKVLQKQGMEFYLGHKVTGASVKGKEVTVTFDAPNGDKKELKGDYCLVAVGRIAYTDSLGLDKIGITVEERGRKITVDEHMETSVKGVYAIGDVIRGAMLAHKAEDEGTYVAETIVGQKPHINYNLIPGVVYTWPEVAAVGQTEEQLKEKGVKYKTGSFPFRASGRAVASGDLDGFVKVLADAATDEILGVHMIGPRAADMIAEAVVAMEYRASAEDISRISHAHPTYTEAMREACLAATDNRPIHI